MHDIIPPHGGTLIDLRVDEERAEALRADSRGWPSWTLTDRQVCDLELLVSGAFSPLTGFLGKADHERVCAEMRLRDDTLWPIPVVLDVTEEAAAPLAPGAQLALREPEGVMLAVLHVEDVWRPDRGAEAETVYGTRDPGHRGAAFVLNRTNPVYVGGRVEGLALPAHYDFRALRATPAQLRAEFAERGWRRVVAFQTRNPMHRAHVELTRRAMAAANAELLVHPVVGMTREGDVDHYSRVRAYEAVMAQYPPYAARLALLPLAMRMAGPREALWHAIIRKNFGATHFIVGRDHAGPGAASDGTPYYQPLEAQALVRAHEDELGIAMVPFQEVVYVQDEDAYLPADEVQEGANVLTLSGTDFRRRLRDGRDIPEWFSYPEVVYELRRTHPPRSNQGFTVFFTGLSGAGKSTIAKVLLAKLLEAGGRPVTLLDGDIVRTNLSSELGFSKAHRDINIRRIGFVASEITKNGGIALCAPIAPYDATRQDVRALIEPLGGFVLVHVATPLDVCEDRDTKGLYAKARAGQIEAFTGISDPYEEPGDAEVVVDTTRLSPRESCQEVLLFLEREGFLTADGRRP